MKEIETYLGFSIFLREEGAPQEQFFAKKGEIEISGFSLVDLKYKIKSTAWEEKEIIAFIGNGYSTELKKVKITKFNKKTGDFNYTILDDSKFFDGSEEYNSEAGKKETAQNYEKQHTYPFNQHNNDIFNKLKLQQKKIQTLEVEEEEIFDKLEGKGKVF